MGAAMPMLANGGVSATPSVPTVISTIVSPRRWLISFSRVNTDKVFSGADTLATSFVLASALRTLNERQPLDLIFTGKQTIDGDTAQVGPGIAIRLGYQLLTYVSKIRELDPAARRLVVGRTTITTYAHQQMTPDRIIKAAAPNTKLTNAAP